MARAMGCSDLASTAATLPSTAARSKPSASTRSVSSGRPLVRVPVLSTATTRASLSACSASPLRNSTPSCAARPVPTMMEVGVASPMAHGQAMMSTATALTSAKVSAGSGPNTNQMAKVARATAMTAGTNHMVMRSTSAWMGSLEPWACSTMRMICASTVSPPTLVARSASAPFWLTVPPTTSAPGCFSTGTGSPLIMDSSTKLVPSVTWPSTGTRSPGRTSTTSPAATCAIGTSTVAPSRRTRAVLACRPIRRLIASEVLPLARASR
ncbi:Uncharacterised protein [Bordetella pertussis]|nr:Uncharacterised protein [Bordetella pertussis]CFM01727.1 Uncharacterised protein [Bordetella pertussis]CFM23624.1 Uncharacterised protein [Bordetella pertussis]CFM49247.1 Uncharacterised protein [Bordetella pertussis]CFM63673.1 Uncharacterised protein [Bordetella pertussis]